MKTHKFDQHHVTEAAEFILANIEPKAVPTLLTYVEDIPWSKITDEMRRLRRVREQACPKQ